MLALLVLVTGCRRAEQITHYRVPKESRETAARPGPYRMMAVLIPHGEQGWFFRLGGSTEAVSAQADKFLAFIKTVKFPAEGRPGWTLPEGWHERADPGVRQATIDIDAPGEPLEVAVTALPINHPDLNSYKLDNVNRWRGQLGLASIPLLRLGDSTQELDLGDTRAMLFDQTGRRPTGGMSAGPGAGMRPLPRGPQGPPNNE
jgi:hypothetical protein